MAATDRSASTDQPVGGRFPALKGLEEQVERTRLQQASAEARAATVRAARPDFKVDIARDTETFGDKTTDVARMLVQHEAVVLADYTADLVPASKRRNHRRDQAGCLFTVISDPAPLQPHREVLAIAGEKA